MIKNLDKTSDISTIQIKLTEYEAYLFMEERSINTISKYIRDLRTLFSFLKGRELIKENIIEWKENLIHSYAPTSVNSMLAASNSFFEWLGISECRVKPLKIQKTIFANPEKELTREEYARLVVAAQSRNSNRLALILQTICGTGIRVSELKFITVEAIKTGRSIVDCKGKSRIVFITKGLCQALNCYCKEHEIKKGIIFCTKSGLPIDRSNIWRDMKALCERAGVESGKVFPHNLRHLFARTYYGLEKDLSRLADLLGHSSINTTRIYTMESGMEHVRQLERMEVLFFRT